MGTVDSYSPPRERQGEEDEEEAQQERSVRGKVETEAGKVQQRSGKAKGGKGKGSKGACFTCGEEGHLKAQCPRRFSETGGIPYRLRRTKAKAKAKAEENVARVKERGTFGILHRRWG